MGAPVPEFEAIESPNAEALLTSLKTIDAAERRKHATVFNYWLSIRGKRRFPPIHDLDPLQISDAGPYSVLLEMVGGGEDAEIRHLGAAIKSGVTAEKLSDSGEGSLLSCIAAKLPLLAATRDAFAFEEQFDGGDGPTRCWVTLLPFGAAETMVDFVYGYVTLAGQPKAKAAPVAEPEAEDAEAVADEPETAVAPEEEPDDALVLDDLAESELSADEDSQAAEPVEEARPGFARSMADALKNLPGFYGRSTNLEMGEWKVEKIDPADEPEEEEAEPAAEADEPEELAADGDEPVEAIAGKPEPDAFEEAVPDPVSRPRTNSGSGLHARLDAVRAKAEEARRASLRATAALIEGLGEAYDFALDAEDEAEDYVKIVEANGLKLKLRSPMAPVARLAFNGTCDDATMAQLEAVLAWAFKQDLPRGCLAERIEAAGGIEAVLAGL